MVLSGNHPRGGFCKWLGGRPATCLLLSTQHFLELLGLLVRPVILFLTDLAAVHKLLDLLLGIPLKGLPELVELLHKLLEIIRRRLPAHKGVTHRAQPPSLRGTSSFPLNRKGRHGLFQGLL